MSGIYIEEVTIKNYKCFVDHKLALSVPDGKTRGSGLNVLIGENGTGKTALLEAINYTNQSSFASENRLDVSDFTDHRKPISVVIRTNGFVCKMSAPYLGCTYDSVGVEFQARSRERKSPGKLLSPPFSINTAFVTEGETYRNKAGEDKGKRIPPLEKQFRNSSIQDSELNIFYFDKSRARQLSTGTYKTTFERICDDLNWKFLKNLSEESTEELLRNITGEYFSNVLALAQRSAGKKLAGEAMEFFDQEQYKNLRIDLVDLLHPFSGAFFAIRDDRSLTQIRPRALGSGIEMILTLLLMRGIAGESNGGVVYLLDEPELHLHPKAQQKLAELLLEEARCKQIIVSTHSPYLFRSFMGPSVTKVILRRNENGQVQIEVANSADWRMFPWSPSWGEINFVAYDMVTVEYHNELYGWLQERHRLANEGDVESFLSKKGVNASKTWTRLKNGTKQPPSKVTLCTYVRNSIHHPENPHNAQFTESELMSSITILRGVI